MLNQTPVVYNKSKNKYQTSKKYGISYSKVCQILKCFLLDNYIVCMNRKFPFMICKYTQLRFQQQNLHSCCCCNFKLGEKRTKKNLSLTPFCSSKNRTSCMAGSNISLSILVKVIPKDCRALSWPQCYSKIGKYCCTSHIDI